VERGTTLGDIRTSSPTAYLVLHNNSRVAFRRGTFVLEDSVAYDLVIPAGNFKYREAMKKLARAVRSRCVFVFAKITEVEPHKPVNNCSNN
jgi:hypothetical protein